MKTNTQSDRILMILQAAYPDWTPAPVLARISLQYSARIHSLRKQGWQIANKVEVVNGVRHGAFRLAQPMTYPNPTKPSAEFNRALATSSLFGDIAPLHKDIG